MTIILPLGLASCLLLALMLPGTLRRLLAGYAILALMYGAVIEAAGTPRAARIELFRDLDRSAISYFEGSESTGIYVVTGRVAYTLPWSEQTMRALHEARQRAEAEGGTVQLVEPRDGTEGGEWSAEHVAPAPLPAKG